MTELDRHYLGGSSAAAAAGLSPFQSPYELWQRLMAPTEHVVKPNRYIYWGVALEPTIRMHYAVKHGVSVPDPGSDFGVIRHPLHDWARATPDGLVTAPDGARWGLEIKTADAKQAHHWGKSGSAKVPIQYKCQCYWYMWVTGLQRWDLVVLLGGNDYREYRLDWDEVWAMNKLVYPCIRFWIDHVETRAPPKATARYSAPATLQDKVELLAAYQLATRALTTAAQGLEHEIGDAVGAETDAFNLDALTALCGG